FIPSPERYTLSLHDALPIFAHATASHPERTHGRQSSSGIRSSTGNRGDFSPRPFHQRSDCAARARRILLLRLRLYEMAQAHHARSEEHTSELQSLAYLVCRL